MSCAICGKPVKSWLMADHLASIHRNCPWCGPWTATADKNDAACPTCGMTPGEHAYRARILADSDAVWREEQAAFQAERQGARS